MEQWDILYQSLKNNYKQLDEKEKQACLKTLTKVSEAMLDKWIEMDEKLVDLKQEIKTVEKSKVFYRSRGTSYFDLNMFEEAIEEFVKEKHVNNKTFIQLYLGFSQLYAKQFEKAKETFLYIIHVKPSTLETHLAYVGLGCLYEQQQMYEEAVPFFEKALTLTMNADVVYNLGICHFMLKEHHLAADYFKRAIKLNEDDGEAYYYLGRCYMKLGEMTKAFEIWMSALQIVETKEFLLTLAYEFEFYGFHLASIHCFKRLETLGFQENSVIHGIAWNYGLIGEKEKSEALFGELLQQEPNNINIWISYLWLLRAWGESTEEISPNLSEKQRSHPLIQQLLR